MPSSSDYDVNNVAYSIFNQTAASK